MTSKRTLQYFQEKFPDWTFHDVSNFKTRGQFETFYTKNVENKDKSAILLFTAKNERLSKIILKNQSERYQCYDSCLILLYDGGFHQIPYDRTDMYLENSFRKIFNNTTEEFFSCGICLECDDTAKHTCKKCSFHTCIACLLHILKDGKEECSQCRFSLLYGIPSSEWIECLSKPGGDFWMKMMIGIDGESDGESWDSEY